MDWKKVGMTIGFWSAVFDLVVILGFLVLMVIGTLR
jgi:hypothetical protein